MTERHAVKPKATKAYALFVAMACVGSFILPQPARADINTSSDLTATLSALSTGGDKKDVTDVITENIGNVKALEGKLAAINTEINAGGTTDEIAQLRAVANALEAIIAKLKAGFTITNYDLTTDAATSEATITMTFKGEDNGTAVLKFEIPGITTDTTGTPDDDDDTGSSGGESDLPDLLTQILQQLGSQLGGGQNPMSNIQGMLNGLMSGTANPLQAVSGAVEEAAASAMQCKVTDSKGGNGDGVAVYDIAAGKVYMPDGTVLEAHSGLGGMMDNPAFVNQRNRGPTPPGVYSLSMRESLFYGTEAIRMTPAGGTQMYGRTGILAHPPLRRGTIGSAGCIAFANYNQFLNAFKQGQVKQIVVVPSVSEANKKCNKPVYETPSPGESAQTPTR